MSTVPPVYLGASTLGASSLTNVVRTTPTHQADDIALLTVEEADQDPTFVDAMGFAELAQSPQAATGLGGEATEVRNYQKRFTDGADDSVEIAIGSLNHIAMVMHLYRGVKALGSPFNVVVPAVANDPTGRTDPAATTVTIPGFTTTVDNCLVVITAVNAVDTTTTVFSAFHNDDLTELTEQINQNYGTGNGGGIAVVTGVKAVAGAVGPTTANMAFASKAAFMVMVLEPEEEIATFPPITGPTSGADAIRDPEALKNRILGATTFNQLKRVLAEELGKLARNVRTYERVVVLPFGATVRPTGHLSRCLVVPVAAITDFTIANPEKPREGAEIILDIHNQTAGAMGTITWDNQYILTSAFTKPAAGKHRLIVFFRGGDGLWRERSRSTNDLN